MGDVDVEALGGQAVGDRRREEFFVLDHQDAHPPIVPVRACGALHSPQVPHRDARRTRRVAWSLASSTCPRSRVKALTACPRRHTHACGTEDRPTATDPCERGRVGRALQYEHDESEYFPMTTTFAGLGLPPTSSRPSPRQGITEPFPIQALTIRRRPRRPRHLRQGQDRLGQDPRLRPPAARADRQGRARAAHGPWCSSPPASSPTRSPTVLAPARQGARPHGQRRLRRRRRWTRRSTALQKGVDVVVGTPGRLIDLIERGELSLDEVEVLVLDEADRMADMGFMPQVQKILYRIDATAPDDAVLGDARRRGQAARRPLHARPDLARGRVETSRRSRRWSTASSSCTRWTR